MCPFPRKVKQADFRARRGTKASNLDVKTDSGQLFHPQVPVKTHLGLFRATCKEQETPILAKLLDELGQRLGRRLTP